MITIKATIRDKKPTAATIRKGGRIPAVFYGRKEAAQAISMDKKDFDKAMLHAGESSVISLEGPWGTHDVLVNDMTRHPLTEAVEHVDFYVLEKDRKVKVRVPLEFVGVSAAVKDLGGTLIKVLHAIEIEALPKNLPSGLTVDIALLSTLESQILAKDVVLPSGVDLVEKAEAVVASVATYKEEVEAPVMDLSQIEVEKKGKVDEEGATGEGTDAKPGGEDAAKKAK